MGRNRTMDYIIYGLFNFSIFISMLLIGPTKASTTCFTMATVNPDSIGFRKPMYTSPGPNSTWGVTAEMKWDRPPGNGYDDFEVWLGFDENPRPTTPCGPMEDNILTNNKTVYTFRNLLHGFTYNFQIRTYDSKHGWYSILQARFTFITPDCFQHTKDKEFCTGRIVETISAPTFLKVAGGIARNWKDLLVTARIQWSEPLQINGTLYGFILIYQVKGSGTDERQTVRLAISDAELKTNKSNGDVVYYEYSLPGLLNDEEYDFEITGLTTIGDETVPGAVLKQRARINVTELFAIRRQLAGESNVPDVEISRTTEASDGPIVGTNSNVTYDPDAFPSWLPWTVIVGASFVIFIAVSCSLRCMLRRNKEAARAEELLSDMNKQKVHHISGSIGEIKEVTGMPDVVFKGRELDRSLLKLDRELGSGQFGIVYKAYAFGVNGAKEFVPVAVKCLKENADMAMKEDFLDEIKLLIEIDDHPNILSVLGCCTIEEPYYLITEYMRYGDLLRFLWKSREERYRLQDPVYDITQQNRLQIARQIARGMEYLSKTRYYHGDLAARNILVGENLVVKISDFGLADDIYQAGYKRLAPDKKRPIKWVSLETNTTGKCTIQSDVWSYGIVLYEIYTSGGVPYPGISGRELIQKLQDGYRMDRPEECPDEIYEVMLSCWQATPSDRPTFNTVYRIMDCLLAERSDYLATDEDKSARRILPLITKTSSSSTSYDRKAPAVPERPRETLGEESDDDWSGEVGEAGENQTGQKNGSFEPGEEEEEEGSDLDGLDGSSLDSLLDLGAEDSLETKL